MATEQVEEGATIAPVWKIYERRLQIFKAIFGYRDEASIGGSTTAMLLEEYRAYYKNISIDSLNSDQYFLRKPISVTIEHFENVYLATNYDLDIYGYGDSEAEALDELKSLILEFFEDLKDEKDLAPVPKKMMAFYQEIIEKR